MNISKTIAVMVIFKPDIVAFKKNLVQLRKNFSKVLIVNNDEDLDLSNFLSKNVLLISNNSNLGLSVAFNLGIEKSKKLGFKNICFFDQDSYIPDNYNNLMHLNINNFKKKYPLKKVAVFSSIFKYSSSGDFSKIYKIHFLRFSAKKCNPNTVYNYSDWAISSGTYISIETLDKIGYFDEKLFIDYVDVEWCLRAKHMNYQCVIFSNLFFTHTLGDDVKKILNLNFYTHSPLRIYYMTRNSLYLFSLKHISLNFFIIDHLRNLLKFIFLLFVDTHRSIDFIKYFFLGYYHGLIKKMGKLEE